MNAIFIYIYYNTSYFNGIGKYFFLHTLIYKYKLHFIILINNNIIF